MVCDNFFEGELHHSNPMLQAFAETWLDFPLSKTNIQFTALILYQMHWFVAPLPTWHPVPEAPNSLGITGKSKICNPDRKPR